MSKEIKGTRELWDLFQRKPLDLYVQAAAEMKEAGIKETPTLSRALEHLSPTEAADKSGCDTFERLMGEAGIITQSDPVAGYWASSADKFMENAGTRALYTEFCARNWRKVSYGQTSQQARATLLSSDGIVGSWERPYYDSLQIIPSQRIQPAIPLSELVAMTTAIDSDAYRSYYMTYDAEKLRKYRVGETAEIPIATLVGAEHTLRLFKYGRGIAISYEAMRRMRVDKLAYYVQWQAVQSEIDKVAAALAILIAGDGNSNTAATAISQSTLDAAATASSDILTLKAWLNFKMQFAQPYVLTTALMTAAVALQVALLNTNSANIPLVMSQNGGLGTGVTPINQFADSVRYGWTSEAPALKIVGFDKRFALERITEIGSEISEMERFITNQTQVMVMSEVEGYAILDGNATKVLDLHL